MGGIQTHAQAFAAAMRFRLKGSLFAAAVLCAASLHSVAKADAPPRMVIHHIAMSVGDVDRLARWYVEKLGFHIAKRFSINDGKVQIAWLDLGGFRIGMMQASGSARAPAQSMKPPDDIEFQGYKHIVYSVENVDDAYRKLLGLGVTSVLPPKTSSPPDIRIAYISDPEGNIIGLYQDIDPANAIAR